MITTRRLLKVVEVVRLWPFFVGGFEALAVKAREEYDLEQMQKTLFQLVRRHEDAYVIVAFNEGVPVGFAVLEDATPLFSVFRSCIARAVYHLPGEPAIAPMLQEFEAWAKEQGYKHYVVTSRRHSGSAVRFFQSDKFGFKRGYITFEKEIQ